ncbi:hypothetical protein [Defluviimonas sp. SAOS-178_SWC]|uniref:hypothetical protein n=1 Tax=Defluviimonas sp. SAOS-178_SWC TaxID=3121287 RepID=UPI003221BFF3
MTVADFLDPTHWVAPAGGPPYIQFRKRIEATTAPIHMISFNTFTFRTVEEMAGDQSMMRDVVREIANRPLHLGKVTGMER